MKVTISFGDTADAAAKPQDRLRFSFGGAKAQCSAEMRSRDTRDVLRYGIVAPWCLKAFSVLKKWFAKAFRDRDK